MENRIALFFLVFVLFLGIVVGMFVNKFTSSACAEDLPCCWYVPKGQRCVKCRDAKAYIQPAQGEICEIRWRPQPYKNSSLCIKYTKNSNYWLCPIEVCRRTA